MAGHISLCRCRVLYLGSAIPLDTAVGIEAIQGPCKDRFDNVDSDNRASGIDAVLSVYSSGLLLQYSSDQSSSSWFPIQTLHVCAAVKAVGSNGPLRFVSLDTAAAQRSSSPPIFACIMRRTKGIKVLECHVFICKSNQAAMALVQSCMHAFGHKEGWSDGAPVPATRIVSGGDRKSGGGKRGGGTIRGGDLYSDRLDLVQKFDVSCSLNDKPKEDSKCNQQVIIMGQQPQQQLVAMNPPGAPVPMVPAGYFADWRMNAGQPLMIIPESPFYPGDEEMERQRRKKKKKKQKKKAAKGSDSEEETIFIKKSEFLGGKKGGGCCGHDSLRSRMRGHGHGGGCCEVVEETILPAPPVIIPKPCPPQVVIVPKEEGPKINKEDKSNRDVIVYAPQYIEANKKNTRVDYNDADRVAFDNRPDNRSYYDNDERYMYDGRADNRINYNRQNYRNEDYRSDNRRFDRHLDNRSFDYRADNRSNREDNRHYNRQTDMWSNREDNRMMDYRADNRSNFMANHQAAAYGGGEMYDPEYAHDEAFQLGYYDAQVEEYNRYLAEGGDDYDDGYDYDYDYGGYFAQPGYTDDYDGGFAQYGAAPEPEGRYELAYRDEYVVQTPDGRVIPGAVPPGVGGYGQVANGLGYYP